MQHKQYLIEVEKRIKALAKKHGSPQNSYFNTQLEMLGDIPVAEQRAYSKKGYSFSGLATQEVEKIWYFIWQSTAYFEVATQALLYFESRRGKLVQGDWKLLKPWANRIDNWAHSDTLCSYFAELHEKFPALVLPTLKSWNGSSEPWLRRQSVVSLFYYSSARKLRQPSFTLAKQMVDSLLKDQHFYVQKAIGWTLREMYNVYPKQTFEYLTRIIQQLPSAAWQAATEKLSAADKKQLKLLRKVVVKDS